MSLANDAVYKSNEANVNTILDSTDETIIRNNEAAWAATAEESIPDATTKAALTTEWERWITDNSIGYRVQAYADDFELDQANMPGLLNYTYGWDPNSKETSADLKAVYEKVNSAVALSNPSGAVRQQSAATAMASAPSSSGSSGLLWLAVAAGAIWFLSKKR